MTMVMMMMPILVLMLLLFIDYTAIVDIVAVAVSAGVVFHVPYFGGMFPLSNLYILLLLLNRSVIHNMIDS